jgi:prepilin-type N-terminal cleavage/methylation domain-containing protein
MANNRGLTIVELVLVMAIIGILASVTIGALNIPKQLGRARDSQRKSDLRAIQSALEFYRADNSAYPTKPVFDATACNTQFKAGTTSVYMNSFPCDPKTIGIYAYTPNGTTGYYLEACLENDSDNDPRYTKSRAATRDATCASGKVYEVTNP